MRLRRKPRRTVCPICGNALRRKNGKDICESCRIEIKGSSLKPLGDDFSDDFSGMRLNG